MRYDFISILGAEMRDFVGFKHAMGHPYERGEQTLRSLDRFIATHTSSAEDLALDSLIFQWLASHDGRKSVTVANDLGVVRQFCLWRRRRTPDSFVPDRHWAPQSTESVFSPHIFSEAEIRMLLEATRTLRRPPFRSVSVRMLITILYCTGLRIGEAVRLCLGDVDLQHGVFTIRQSKGKTRLVPFDDDLLQATAGYLARRRAIADDASDSRLLLRGDNEGFTVRTAGDAIRRLLRRTGLKPSKGRVGPRVHDLRHTFAVHRLTRWYATGEDIHALLPWLSAYMGHDNIIGTELYLHATPELMAIAGERLRAHCFGGG